MPVVFASLNILIGEKTMECFNNPVVCNNFPRYSQDSEGAIVMVNLHFQFDEI